MLKKSVSGVLASFRSSMYPTREKSCSDSSGWVDENRYASGLHSLRPCWTNFLSILRDPALVLPHILTPRSVHGAT